MALAIKYTFVPSVTLTRLPRRSLHEKITRLPVKSWAHLFPYGQVITSAIMAEGTVE